MFNPSPPFSEELCEAVPGRPSGPPPADAPIFAAIALCLMESSFFDSSSGSCRKVKRAGFYSYLGTCRSRNRHGIVPLNPVILLLWGGYGICDCVELAAAAVVLNYISSRFC